PPRPLLPPSPPFPYTTLFRSSLLAQRRAEVRREPRRHRVRDERDRPLGRAEDVLVRAVTLHVVRGVRVDVVVLEVELERIDRLLDRKSTRLNSSHRTISYAVF